MIRIRVGIASERSQEIYIEKSFDDITTTDIRKIIGERKRIMGWLEIDENGNYVSR